MPDPRDFLPQPPWEGPPIPRILRPTKSYYREGQIFYHGAVSKEVADKIYAEGFKLGMPKILPGLGEPLRPRGLAGPAVYLYGSKSEYILASVFYPYYYTVTAKLRPGLKIAKLDMFAYPEIGESAKKFYDLVKSYRDKGCDGVDVVFSTIPGLTERQRMKIWAGDQIIIFDPSNVIPTGVFPNEYV